VKHSDRASAIFWFVLSLIMVEESYRLELGTLHFPKAGLLPFMASLALGILSLILIISTVSRGQKDIGKDTGFELNRQRLPKLLYVLASLFAYAILLNILGFVLCTLIFIVFLLIVIEPQKLFIVIIAGISVPLITYVIFALWLKLQLPKGVLGF